MGRTFSQAPPGPYGLKERKEGAMIYVMPLVIVGVNGTEITVVNGPVALRRGGALAH